MRQAFVVGLSLLVAPPQPSLAELLSRAATHVVDFERGVATVISDERYEQHTMGGYRSVGSRSVVPPPLDRVIESEMLVAWLEREHAWLALRNVLTVDGQVVDGSEPRLDRLLTGGGPISLSRLRQLRDGSARFNIGGIHRNFNDPLSPLRFLEPGRQSGFKFRLDGEETIGQATAWRVTFSEERQPFIEPTPSHGTFWIARDGTVLRTRLDAARPVDRVTGSIVVDYEYDPKLHLMVPATMHEVYAAVAPTGSIGPLGAIDERITCDARYSNYRRFDTAARIVPD